MNNNCASINDPGITTNTSTTSAAAAAVAAASDIVAIDSVEGGASGMYITAACGDHQNGGIVIESESGYVPNNPLFGLPPPLENSSSPKVSAKVTEI